MCLPLLDCICSGIDFINAPSLRSDGSEMFFVDVKINSSGGTPHLDAQPRYVKKKSP